MATPNNRDVPAQRSLRIMSSGARSWLPRAVLVVAILAAIREVSIRRHSHALHDWPRYDHGDQPT